MGTSCSVVARGVLASVFLAASYSSVVSLEAAPDGEPWLSSPAFSIPAADLNRAVAALPQPSGAAIEFLLVDASVTLDAEGKETTTTHVLYRILTPAAIAEGSTVRRAWAPWREQRPAIRARVVTPDGVQHDLDPATLSDAPFGTADRNVFSDLRVVEGPLPAVSSGSIVEIETVQAAETTLFEAGTVITIPVADSLPVRRARVRIEVPESFPLRFASRPAGAFRESETGQDGKQSKTFELESFEPPAEPEAFLPPDLDPSAVVSFSTGESWAAVAAAYSDVVDRQIAGAELRAAVKKATASAKTRSDKILALMRYLHDTVRYTGVEFGWAGIVPEKPSLTLARKYGDCKDKSALLVALLREAGIPSHLALLEVGLGPDVEPELPGLGRFDHAIVRVDGDPPTWIDATNEFGDPGALAPGVEGRLALVVRQGTSGLERIPEARSQDHRIVEVREFFLAEEGPARVVETTRVHGRYAYDYRSGHATQDAKDTTEVLEEYVRTTYEATLDRHVTSDPKDLTIPFELRMEMSGSTVGESNGREVQVPVPLYFLAGDLLALIPARPPEGEMERTKRDPERRGDFLVAGPYVSEWKYRIHRPEAFSSLPLPDRVERSIGPAALTAEFHEEDDGTVTVDARFDTGRRRWTAEEYEAARRALYELQRDNPWVVSFQQNGEVELEAGRLREALAEFRRLASLHPTEALHPGQIAKALLAAGFGEAARREAARGVELEPQSSKAQQRLGLTLINDELGRELRKGSDLEGAEAALRKAKALDPKNVAARALLGLVLEHDTDGTRYSSRSKLGEAIEEYRSLRADIGDTTVDLNLLQCLGQAGRMQELREEAMKLPESADRNKLLIAAVAVLSGIDAARGEASRLASGLEDRRGLLAGAGATLLLYRRYAEAGPLLEAGLGGSGEAAERRVFLEILKKTKRHEEITFDSSKPEQVALDFFRSVLSGGDLTGQAGNLFLSRHVQLEESEQARAMYTVFYMLQSQVGDSLTVDGILDIALAGLESEVTPIGSMGYQVRWSSPAERQKQHDILLVKEEGRLKILGGPPDVSAVGRLVEQLVVDGDLENARQWLNHIREKLSGAPADDPIAAHPMAVLWTFGDPADPQSMRAAAVALRIGPGHREDVAPLLEQLRSDAAEADRWKLDYALAQAHAALRRNEAALACAERLLEIYPRSRSARDLLAANALASGRLEAAEGRAREWLVEDPTSRQALRFFLGAAQKRGDMEEAARRFGQLQGAGRAEAFDLNNQAWFLLENGRADEALALAQRSVREENTAASIHTLACIYADLGRLTDARETILRKIEWFGGGEVEPIDGFVFGRIAEHLGEKALAMDVYRRTLEGPPEQSEATRRIVQQRIQALQPS